jgi:serine/threonine protein kinase
MLQTIGMDLNLLNTSSSSAQTMAREISRNELLQQNPHPNVARYHGVTISRDIRFKTAVVGSCDHDVVTGLVFQRYQYTLSEIFDAQHPIAGVKIGRVPIDQVVADVKAGIEHIHSLGFVHCDIKPDNIFYSTREDRFVVGDLDSCHEVDEGMRLKLGTRGWSWVRAGTAAAYKHEFEALGKLEEWMYRVVERVRRERSRVWKARDRKEERVRWDARRDMKAKGVEV